MSQAQTGNPKEDLSFGELAIRENLCTVEQVKECLDIQARLRSIGIEPKRLGEILVEKRYLSPEQAERIARTQSQHPARSATMVIPGYAIISKIGQGAMGAVYKARQLSMDRVVAIKVLAPRHSRDEKYVARFLNEARAVAKLNHEHVISGIDVGESLGVHYFVMEYVDGTTVARQLQQGKIEEKRCLQIALQISRALDHAQRHSILHRDIKPENIMITADGIAKLCDLGLARQTASDASSTMDGYCVGTPSYISPEQARGEQNLDIRTDIYSLGATLYHMSTGRTPFSGPNPMAVMTKHVTEQAEPPRKVNPALTEGFSNMILRMMQKSRQDRYQTPADLIADIEKLLKGGTVATATHPGKITSSTRTPALHARPAAARPARSSSAASPATLLAILLGLVVVVGAGLFAVSRAGPGSGEGARGSSTAGPTPVVDPSASTDCEREHGVRLALWRDLCTRLAASNAPSQLTEPYARAEVNIGFFSNRQQETIWRNELDEFVRSKNKLVMETVWARVRQEVQDLRQQGKLREAVRHAGTLPEAYRAFKRNERSAETERLTDAELERRDLVRSIEEEISKQTAQGRAELEKACSDGRFDDALRVWKDLAALASEEQIAEMQRLRESVVGRDIGRLTPEPLTPGKEAAAVRRIEELQKRYPDDAAFGQFLEGRKVDLARRATDARTGATQKAKAAYDAFAPAFRKAIGARDVVTARRGLRALFKDPKNEAVRPALMERAEDLAVIDAYLDPATTAPDFAALVRLAEESYRSASLGGRETVALLALDLREAVLLDRLLLLAMRGAEAAARQAPPRVGLRSVLAEATEVRPAPRPSADAAYRLELTARGVPSTLSLSPATPPAAEPDEIVNLASRALAEPDPAFHMAVGLLYFHAGEAWHPHAKAELLKVSEPPPGTLARYLTPLELVATEDDEKRARDLWRDANDAYLKAKNAEAKALFQELVDRYGTTKFMKAPQSGVPRAQIAGNFLKELGGKGKQKKVEDLFHAKVRTVGPPGKERYEVTYDFSNAAAFSDFTKDALGMGREATWEYSEKAIQGDGSGILNWNATVTGDLQLEWTVRARDNKNIGFTFPATGTFFQGEGYIAWLAFSNESGRPPQKISLLPAHPLYKLPWSYDRRISANFGKDREAQWALQPGTTFTVKLIRKGTLVDFIVNDKVTLTSGTLPGEGLVTAGKIGVALWQSKAVLVGARLNVMFDKVWLTEAIKADEK